jgi:uncharacterized DUF497 family protein
MTDRVSIAAAKNSFGVFALPRTLAPVCSAKAIRASPNPLLSFPEFCDERLSVTKLPLADLRYEAKRKKNIADHKIDFHPAARYFEWEFALVMEDLRKDYGEQRFLALAPIGNKLYSMCFTTPATGKIHITRAQE